MAVLFLFIIIVLAGLVLASGGIVLATVFNRLAGKSGSDRGARIDQPGCGNCGYPVRGMSSFQCPECGEDLRKVGIVKPGDSRVLLAGCLWPMLLTLAVPLLAVAGYMLLGLVVPHHQKQSNDFMLFPASDQYAHVQFQLDATVITPAGTAVSYTSFDMTTTSYSPPVSTIDIGDSKSTLVPTSISFEVMPTYTSATANTTNYAPRFMVDPTTGVATWTDAQGQLQVSQGPVKDKDILAYLGSTGADTSNADVIIEAQQLHGLIDGLCNGTSQFQIQHFKSGGYGSGGGGQIGPVWMLPVYAGVWFLIWIIGLVVIIVRGRKANAQG